ncbi:MULTISPECIES: helix-turn-helix domain-containing protein [Paenibacillus]|uniref:HTH cro/C1-type domain-containing protein n=1 Tax=Paenibacillus albilobatus TaxID=2716884 RepID=A0A919XND7_9BACL|nr:MULTISPECIES: helix-turn-helix transcriptional regulator [Paenibacillus]GIO34598.1 hypothetical protein J2TS6_57390 [Paenibacillus albilobatus]
MIDPYQVGNNIYNLRKIKHLTQLEPATKINVSHQAVSKWERGDSLPDLESLYQLSNVFSIKIDDLIKRTTNDIAQIIDNQIDIKEPLIVDEENVNIIWQRALSIINERISKPSFDVWYKNTSAKFNNGTIIIVSPNEFSTDWLRTRYAYHIREALSQVLSVDNINVAFQSLE